MESLTDLPPVAKGGAAQGPPHGPDPPSGRARNAEYLFCVRLTPLVLNIASFWAVICLSNGLFSAALPAPLRYTRSYFTLHPSLSFINNHRIADFAPEDKLDGATTWNCALRYDKYVVITFPLNVET